MKIVKVLLYNFSSFEGLNELDFSIEEEKKNIILIGGKNGAGKTSLFTAIKLALYGPQAFGYVGMNPHYIAKIREYINTKAFQTGKVEAWVQINLSLVVEREIRNYEVIREWDYSGQKLLERYYVKLDGRKLNDQETSYFQNYLKSLVPPELFEFFFFDGEEVGSIFSTDSYNSYIKNAVYTLCGLDIYEIIRKYTHGYVGKASTKEEEQAINAYEKIKREVESAEDKKEQLSLDIETMEKKLEQLNLESLELETSFRNLGGITEEERKKLKQDYDKAERLKREASMRLKMFVEGDMPFYIVGEFAESISNQLECEEDGALFRYIQQKLTSSEIQDMLPKFISKDSVDPFIHGLLEKFRPKGFQEDFKPMYNLSKEDYARVNAMLLKMRNFDEQSMILTVKQKQEATDCTAGINKKLKNAMPEEEFVQFQKKENEFLRRKNAIERQLYTKKADLEELTAKIEELADRREQAKQKARETMQNQHVFEISNRLYSMMDVLLKRKIKEVKWKLETEIVKNLHQIYRKNNLITHIEIDDAFQFHLYQDASYTAEELSYLMKNYGKDRFSTIIGEKGKQFLCEHYQVDSLRKLQGLLSFRLGDTFELYKNIDLNRLSKGERQIFILSLYWAIIKLSDQEIPFIIDTPYARIDANHRKEISEKFFPNISSQVIILSTDEEINEEYYQIIRPYIAREYLLINDEKQNKTSVEGHYFFEKRI